MKKLLKKIGVYSFLYTSYFTIKRLWNILVNKFKKTATIVTYHRIGKVSCDPHMLCVAPEIFEQHLVFFTKNYNIVSLEKLVEKIQTKTLDGTELAITLDDGYQDNLLYALPILEKYNAPATIFVTTSALGKRADFTWDRKYTTEDRANFLSEAEICELSKHPLITIAAHTSNHPRLSRLDYSSQKNEIENSKKTLEHITKKKISGFAYPFGGSRDINANSVQAVKDLYFSYACTTNERFVTHNSPLYQLPRFNIREYSDRELSQYIQK